MKTDKTRVKLTAEQVVRIVKMHRDRRVIDDIAEAEGLSASYCSNVIRAYGGHKKNYNNLSKPSQLAIRKARNIKDESPIIRSKERKQKKEAPAVVKSKGISLLWGLVNIKF